MEEWDPKDTEVLEFQDEKVKEELESNPMYRLEHGLIDKEITKSSAPRISQLQHLNDEQWADPYTKSQKLRKRFREEKKSEKATREESERIRDKHSLHIELLPETKADEIQSKSIDYDNRHLFDQKRLQTAVSPLFQKAKKQPTSLEQMAKIHTRLKTDPFYSSKNAFFIQPKRSNIEDIKITNKKRKEDSSSSNAGLVLYSDSEEEEEEEGIK